MDEMHTDSKPTENEDVKIWRYMDFTKFVSLLDTRALFFARADKLGDPFEGSISRVAFRSRAEKEEKEKQEFKKHGWHLDSFEKSFSYEIVRCTAISSWHINEDESPAMWKIYLKSDKGIAIQSTMKRLKTSLGNNREILIDSVKYVDYEKDINIGVDSIDRFFHKRKIFEHEREVRAVITILNKHPIVPKPIIDNGIYISVNLDTLIEKIYVAPTCPKWLTGLVKSISKKYNLEKPVLQSELDKQPIY